VAVSHKFRIPRWVVKLGDEFGVFESSDDGLAILVLATYLDSLSKSYGLSEHHEDEALARALQYPQLLPLIDHYIVDSHVLASDLELLRNVLYRELESLSCHPVSPRVAQVLAANVTPRLVYYVGQVNWALSQHRHDRPCLPFGSGSYRTPTSDVDGVAWSPVSQIEYRGTGKAVDLAGLRHTDRTAAARLSGLPSSSRLRAKAQRLCFAIADRLVSRRPVPADVISVLREGVEVESGAAAIDTTEVGTELPPTELLGPVDEHLRHVRALHEAAGNSAAVEQLTAAIIAALEAIEVPTGDQESLLLWERLRRYEALSSAGRYRESTAALDELTDAITKLHERRSSDPQVRLQFALIVMLKASVLLLGGEAESLVGALEKAVEVAQRLTDDTGRHEDVLVMALILLAIAKAPIREDPSTSAELARAVPIARRLLKSEPEQRHLNVALVAGTLLAQLLPYVLSERFAEAHELMREAHALIDEAAQAGAGLPIEVMSAMLAETLWFLEDTEDLSVTSVHRLQSAATAMGAFVPSSWAEVVAELGVSQAAAFSRQHVTALLVLCAADVEIGDRADAELRLEQARSLIELLRKVVAPEDIGELEALLGEVVAGAELEA